MTSADASFRSDLRTQDSGDTVEEKEDVLTLENGRRESGTVPLSQAEEEQSSLIYRVYKRRWFGLLALMGMNIVTSWGWLTFAPVSSVSQEYYNLSTKTPINWLSTVVLFTYALATPAMIYIVNHYGIKISIQISCVLSLAGFWIRYVATIFPKPHGCFPAVMFGQILIGIAQPFVLSSPTYYSDLWFTSRSRVSATALASLSNPFGAALGQLINPFFATEPSQIPRMMLYISIIATVPSILSLFIPAKPPFPPCPSAASEKLPLAPSLKLIFKNKEFMAIFILFSTYLGLFNAFSSLINQIMEPYGYTETEAGLTGAVLIVVGLVFSAIVSPIVDRTHAFALAIRLQIPLIALCYIAFIFAPTIPNPPSLVGPMIIAAILGASSFSLLPLSLEYVVERTSPVSPELTSGILWMGGQALGGILLLVMDRMRIERVIVKSDGRMIKGDMWTALIFEGVLAAAVCPLVWFVGRGKNVGNRRVEMDMKPIRESEEQEERL